MSDIFGRSTSRPADGITRRQIASMIKRYVTSGLNLVDVDPGEIVVFQDKEGKLKTSNVSFDSLLMKPEGADDDSIAVFKQNKITAGDKLSSITDQLTVVKDTADDLKLVIDDLAKFFGSPRQTMDIQIAHIKAAIDNLSTLRAAYDTHIKTFGNFRNNIVEKFLGKDVKPKDVTPTLAEIKTTFANIENARKKLTDDIADINSRLGVVRDTKSISDLIAINKKSIEDIKKVTDDIKAVTDVDSIPTIKQDIENFKQWTAFIDKSRPLFLTINKIKIPYDINYVKGISCVISQELNREYLKPNRIPLTLRDIKFVGIYRFTAFSEHQLDIKIMVSTDELSPSEIIIHTTGINTALLYANDIEKKYTALVKPVDDNVVRAKFGYILEYVSAIDNV